MDKRTKEYREMMKAQEEVEQVLNEEEEVEQVQNEEEEVEQVLIASLEARIFQLEEELKALVIAADGVRIVVKEGHFQSAARKHLSKEYDRFSNTTAFVVRD